MSFYRIIGHGSNVIVCFSGFLYGSWIYDYVTNEFDRDNYRFILIENQNILDACENNEDKNFEYIVKVCLDMLDQHEIEQFFVMGFSMGGFIAQQLVSSVPDRITGMILMCTMSGGENFSEFLADTSDSNLDIMYSLDKRLYVQFSVNQLFSTMFINRNQTFFNDFVSRQVQELPSIEAAKVQSAASLKFMRLGQVFNLYDFPTLLTHGDSDTTVNLAAGIKLSELIKNSKLVVFEGAKHFFFIEQKKTFVQVVDKFVSEVLASL